MPEPSPENLYEASKRKKHVLHKDLWAEDDAVWALRGRLERARHVISSIVIVEEEDGDVERQYRAFEYVSTAEEAQWCRIERIIEEPDLLTAHMAGIMQLQEQALRKMEVLQALLGQR